MLERMCASFDLLGLRFAQTTSTSCFHASILDKLPMRGILAATSIARPANIHSRIVCDRTGIAPVASLITAYKAAAGCSIC